MVFFFFITGRRGRRPLQTVVESHRNFPKQAIGSSFVYIEECTINYFYPVGGDVLDAPLQIEKKSVGGAAAVRRISTLEKKHTFTRYTKTRNGNKNRYIFV